MWLEIGIFILLVLILRYYITRPKGLPPGPMKIPYLGNMTSLQNDKILKYRKQYGDIFMTEMASTKFVFFCNYKDVKEALSRPELASRPDMEFAHFLSDGVPGGVINTNGQHWQNARRFLLRNLRDLGMGKSYLEEAIQREAQTLVEDFKKHSKSPTLFPESLNVAVLNVVWQMVANTRYEMDDEKILSIVKILRSFETSNILLFMEFTPLKKIVPNFLKIKIPIYKMVEDLKVEGKQLMEELIASHRAKLDPDNPRDVIDEYLVAMDEKSDIASHFSELDLMRVTFDLFQAGFDTVSNMLRWIILYMIKYPEVQRRVQQQIDEVVPSDTLPSYEHKPKLPLVEAVVHEALRFSSMISIGVQRGPDKDMYFREYLIPKDSFVFGVALTCHNDPQYWEQPDQFRLEHFLDEEGKFVSQKNGFVPFGSGRRSCLGETLARMELYIFTAALLQNFTFSVPDGCEVNINGNPKIDTANMPINQNIVITPRTNKTE